MATKKLKKRRTVCITKEGRERIVVWRVKDPTVTSIDNWTCTYSDLMDRLKDRNGTVFPEVIEMGRDKYTCMTYAGSAKRFGDMFVATTFEGRRDDARMHHIYVCLKAKRILREQGQSYPVSN
jgi:hypothetical protein